MPHGTQSKILRVLVDQTFQRVGGTEKIQVDLRVIYSPNKDLPP
jgi:two-component system nitrogen regulation response regulator NtrX